MIPYSRQQIEEDDIQAVVQALKGDFLTTGPLVADFEREVCSYTNALCGVAVSSGTAALHASMFAINLKPGDEVIVPAITFAASANCVVFQGGKPVFCDVDSETLLIDVNKIEGLITKKTKAIIAVDYAGQPCDYSTLKEIAWKHKLFLISDACHSIGAQEHRADITVYSFHPVKHITTGEGGMAVTNDKGLADAMRRFRFHGMHEGMMFDLGYNYRITDFQCALGISQLKKLDGWIKQRREIAKRYDERLTVGKLKAYSDHVYHLYVVKIPDRDAVQAELHRKGIRATIHYKPVYYHPYYWSYKADCPEAEKAYKEILSIPCYPGLTEAQQDYVIETLEGLVCPE